jgi:hypothetical protein
MTQPEVLRNKKLSDHTHTIGVCGVAQCCSVVKGYVLAAGKGEPDYPRSQPRCHWQC